MSPNRRSVLMAIAAVTGSASLPTLAETPPTPPETSAAPDDFDRALAAALASPQVQKAARLDREGALAFFNENGSLAATPHYPPSNRAVSKHAVDLLIGFEVSSPALYHKRYERPVVPGGESGLTIGVGYDLGYVSKVMCKDDWSPYLPADQVAALMKVCTKTKADAKLLRPSVSEIVIPWDVADKQFRTCILPRYVAMTLYKLPNASKLSDDSLGALVSLIYNRGASFTKPGARYKEMRAIKDHLENEEFAQIPGEIRAMKWIWKDKPDLAGLLTRRDLEAQLFEVGLTATAAPASA
jgi:hypothetical protein